MSVLLYCQWRHIAFSLNGIGHILFLTLLHRLSFLLWRRSRDSNPDRRRVSPAQGLEPCVLTVTPLLYVLLSVGIEPTSPCSALSYESRSPADGAGNPFMKLLTSGQRRAPRGLETLVGSSSNLNYFCPARRTWSPIRGLNSELIG